MIYDSLKEILAYTQSLGFLELVKVTGSATSTELNSMANDKTVVLESQFINSVPEFEGVFGLHDLGRLNTILNIPEYKENAVIQVIKGNNSEPVSIAFQNANHDFRNDYRFMGKEIVELQLPAKTRKPLTWAVSFTPSLTAIQRLKFQAQAAGSSETTFNARVDNGNLYFAIGDHSSHSGEFVFEAGVKGSLSVAREWPLEHVQGILNLTGDKHLQIADAGAMEITVISGLATHRYTIMAQTK